MDASHLREHGSASALDGGERKQLVSPRKLNENRLGYLRNDW